MLNRAATFSDGGHPMRPINRRRSSIFSDISDTRSSFLPAVGTDMDTFTSSDGPSVWQSAPLAFAILPAVGGLLFKNGSSIVTDILLLVFGSMFLNWCVRAPWDWYHAAQQVQFAEEDVEPHDRILEEVEENGDAHTKDDASSPKPPTSETPVREEKGNAPTLTNKQKGAGRELAREEIFALIACFLGPILGAYLLHQIRSQLSRPAEGLISNYNLTIFVMAAELRPFSHIIKMKQARMVHLQRIVHPSARNHVGSTEAQELSRRLSEVEARLTEPVTGSPVEVLQLGATIRQSVQPQLDALNRAVRRYEKRQVAQTIQVEARFGELEKRMQDALSLAAAAARTGQRPGMVSMVFTWAVNFATYWARTGWAIATYPLKIPALIGTELRSWFVKNDPQPRRHIKGQSSGYS